MSKIGFSVSRRTRPVVKRKAGKIRKGEKERDKRLTRKHRGFN